MDAQVTNGLNAAEDSEMADCDGEKVMTMMDVLQEQQDIEDDANAVLGASDDKECTYSKGYIKRQAIYACLTCCSEAKTNPSKRAGVCLACSLNCHENHEMVELYTKRNFRCDCGNPNFESNPCQFTQNKTELNEDNSYNQNFSGVYCTCSRPYPDPESTVEDEMIQCIICEDWLHESHLETKLPTNDQYAEMICKGCMDKNEFLHDYSSLAVNVLENEVVDVDDSIIKDSTSNGEGEVEVNGVNGSVLEEAESNVKDIVMDEAKAEKIAEISQSEEKAGSIDESIKETAPELTENSFKQEKIDQLVSESSPEELSKEKIETLSEEQVNQECEHKDTEATLDQSEITKDVPSEAVTADGAADSSKKPEICEEIPAEACTEDKPQESEPGNEQGENLEEKSQLAAEGNSTVVKDVNAKLDDQPSAKKDQDESVNSTDATNADSKPDNAPPTVDNKEVVDPAADDDNKEIDAIDKLLAEGHNEESTDHEPAPEKMETEVDSLAETTSDTNNKSEQNSEKKEHDILLSSNENAKEDMDASTPSKQDNDTLTTDVEMNKDSTDNVETSDNTLAAESLTNGCSEGNDNKRKLSDVLEESQDNSKKPKLDVSSCVRPKAGKKIFKGATFWPSHFRQKLCTCGECITMYKDLSVLFLTDLEDTVKAYEDLGKERNNGAASTQYEKGLEALSSLDRIQQINALTEYNRMKDKLLDFLKSFKDRKEVVKEEDIKAFFAKMKPKREPDGVYFCR